MQNPFHLCRSQLQKKKKWGKKCCNNTRALPRALGGVKSPQKDPPRDTEKEKGVESPQRTHPMIPVEGEHGTSDS